MEIEVQRGDSIGSAYVQTKAAKKKEELEEREDLVEIGGDVAKKERLKINWV